MLERTSNPPDHIFKSPQNIIIIYTSLSLILKMRSVLGLEAMLEYLEKHLSLLEKYNPDLKGAVARALELINVKKIYNEAMEQ